jgi:large subunit ribosomal protein L25
MKTASLSGSLRGGVGKKDAATLRVEGRVPGVLYGGTEQIHFHVAKLDIERLVINPDVFRIALDVDGTTYDTILQEIQFHPVTDYIIHIDALQLDANKPVRVELPVRTTGTSPGVMNGGRLEMQYRRVPVRGLPNNLPESISVDISKLEIGSNTRVRDLNVEGCEILLSDSTLIAAVKRTRAAIAAAAAADEGGAE